MIRKLWEHAGVVFFNHFFTHFPSHRVRQAVLRLWGAKIGPESAIFRGTTVLGIAGIRIGEASVIGFRCLLDGRGGLSIGDNVVIASDVHFIAGHHLPNSDDFGYVLEPTIVEDYAWIASRATVLEGITVGRGAVVGACSLVRRSVEPMQIAAGIPAKPVAVRRSALTYRPVYRPKLF
jgi:acetyltransferase-like isoleucine patch superfamily enzyme